jgi:hypothetical protein
MTELECVNEFHEGEHQREQGEGECGRGSRVAASLSKNRRDNDPGDSLDSTS